MLDCQIAILENAVSRYFSEKKFLKKMVAAILLLLLLNALNAEITMSQ